MIVLIAAQSLLTSQHWCWQALGAAGRRAKALAEVGEADNKPLRTQLAKLEKSAIAKACGASQHFSTVLLFAAVMMDHLCCLYTLLIAGLLCLLQQITYRCCCFLQARAHSAWWIDSPFCSLQELCDHNLLKARAQFCLTIIIIKSPSFAFRSSV